MVEERLPGEEYEGNTAGGEAGAGDAGADLSRTSPQEGPEAGPAGRSGASGEGEAETADRPPVPGAAPPAAGGSGGAPRGLPPAELGRPWRLVLLGLLGLLVLCYTVNKVGDFDLWWHLATGRYFLSGGSFAADPFAFTTAGHRWTEIHWLYQIFLALLERLGGINLLIFFKAALVGGAFLLLYRYAEGGRSPILAPALFGLAVLTGAERFLVRPETVSYLFVALFLVLLERYRRERRVSLLVWLVVVELVWVNMQALFALGLVLIGCYLAGELARWKMNLPYRWTAENPLRDRAWMLLLAAGGACLVVTLFNPSGIHGALFPFEQFQMIQGDENIFRRTILEFDRPFSDRLSQDNPATRSLVALLLLSLTSFALTFRQWDVTRVLVYAAFLFLGLSARRNIALFALVAAPMTVINFRQWAATLSPGEWLGRAREALSRWRPWAAAAVALLLVWGVWMAASDESYIHTVGQSLFGLGVNEEAFPVAATDLLLEKQLAGPLYNELSFGGYLLYRLYPQQKIFIDGRNELYGTELYTRYINTLAHPERWYDLAREYNLQLALLNIRSPIDDGLVQLLYRDPEWALIHHDGIAVLFARRGPANRAAIERMAQDLTQLAAPPAEALPSLESRRSPLGRVYPAAEIHLGMFYLKLGLPALARPVLEKAVELRDGLTYTLLYLGEIYAQENQPEKALAVFQKVTQENPQLALAYERMGAVYHQNGRVEQALANYRRALERGLDNALLRTNLGDCFLQLDMPQEALAEFEQAVAFAPDNADVRYNLAFGHQFLAEVRRSRGDQAAAEEEMAQAMAEYSRVLEIDPGHYRSLFNLALIYRDRGQIEDSRRCLLTFLALPEVEADFRRQAEEVLAQVQAGLPPGAAVPPAAPAPPAQGAP